MPDPSIASIGYNKVASAYNSHLADDQWIRSLLWSEYLAHFKSGDHILDIGCGTGIDAIFLAQHRMHVTGIDVSSGMIAQSRSEIESSNLTDYIDFKVLDADCISSLSPTKFDGIISAFAGINMVTDIRSFGDNAADLLKPNGHMILHVLNWSSMWKRIAMAFNGESKKLKSIRSTKKKIIPVGDTPIEHYFYTPEELYNNYLASKFKLLSGYSLVYLLPRKVISFLPRSLKQSYGFFEKKIGSYKPFLYWGEFFVLKLIKK
jgi:2-polyprenyl-3-methyl-5-hydroxy-6-metoxy-1,4-benzoquinol methylase